ncbi:hypothetical protein A4R35_02080 [Thermogemmatispora tikiterensis]|uniref:Methyltransferase type 11 domain-containing protein n=1 Tax=Thermogemmatispora tikiterensis TaxID=1825093 RepID=A0A328VE63_9CHLR|nr:hypothetical protein [Thermogemmatispora tikiterensis]RAQ94302.1 hypothetical protein A4R35_02080 [Thermogemmatispora tikiterensis]
MTYFPNPLAALESVRRHLNIGGCSVAATWCSPEESPIEGLPDEIGAKSAHISLLERGIPGPFNLSDSQTLEEKFTQAGFSEVSSEKLSVAFEFASVDDFVL